MQFSKLDYTATPLKEYRVHGCRRPSEKEPQPQIFVATVFAINTVFARSRFAQMVCKQHKIKSTECEILRIEEVPQDNDFELKNYGIDVVYRAKNVLQNAYKEVRHINRVLAVAELQKEFGARHRVKASQVFVRSIRVLGDDEVTKPHVLSYIGEEVAFPVFFHVPNTTKEFVPATTEVFN